MRESPKTDKTKLPPDTYEDWLKSQKMPAERSIRRTKKPTDSYEEWLEQRIRD